MSVVWRTIEKIKSDKHLQLQNSSDDTNLITVLLLKTVGLFTSWHKRLKKDLNGAGSLLVDKGGKIVKITAQSHNVFKRVLRNIFSC